METRDQLIKNQIEFLKQAIVQLYGSAHIHEYQAILDQINDGVANGCCAK